MQKEYKASLDKLAKVVTIGIAILFVVIGAGSLASYEGAMGWEDIGSIALMIAIFGIAYLWAPKKYLLTDKHLVVKRPIGAKRFELDQIDGAMGIEHSNSGAVMRTFGVGGLFGYFGKFYSTNLGSVTYYVTDRKKYVLVRFKDGRKIMLSPDDGGFVEDLKARI